MLRQIQGANPEIASLSLRIHCLTNDLPYSFVLGNGAAYVTTGLLERLDNGTPNLGQVLSRHIDGDARVTRGQSSSVAQIRAEPRALVS